MFSARFNEKNKEACIAVVTRIQALKLFGTHIQFKWSKNHQESFRRIVLSTKLQACTAVVAEDTEMKFRAVHQLLVENQYEILMVEAGVEKTSTAHLKTPIIRQKN